ncbi:hypothetical protein Scep_016508 [Stephania cephalantha]|uniref:Uncharacterized protein n=1 Tax=Stephania cephalantha TaxID=152367 RepID=A0AAP0INB8_9MAGN
MRSSYNGLGWTPSRSRRRHSGARAGDVAGSYQPISAPNEPIELLRKNFKQMQINILRVMQDNTLTRDELQESGTVASHGANSNRQT